MRSEWIARALSLMIGIAIGVFLGSAFMGAPVEDVDRHVRIIYDVTSGVRMQGEPGITTSKIPCYDGDPTRQCLWINCPACPECDLTCENDAVVEELIPESSVEPTG